MDQKGFLRLPLSFLSSRLPRFAPHPDLEGDAGAGFMTVHVDIARVVQGYRASLFSFEWLTPQGDVKQIYELAPNFADQRHAVEEAINSGGMLYQPILGIGLLGNIEIGAGRDVLLTLAAHGLPYIPVHIPVTMEKEFKKMIVTLPPSGASQAGNVLVYILLAIVLLAALSFVISRGMRSGGTSAVADHQAGAYAAEILGYANQVKTAVVKLSLRGCGQDELNFDNTVVAGYTNAGAPADQTCDVFAPPGGTIAWATPSSVLNDGTPWFYTGVAVVHNDHGVYSNAVAANADLTMMLFGLPQNVCTQINKRLGLVGIPVDDSAYGAMTKFTGTYAATEDINGLPEASQPSPCASPSTALNFCGRDAGCFREESGGERYIFFQVLLRR